MAGMAFSRKWNCELPVFTVYQDVMEILNGTANTDEETKARAQQYKDKIIGKTALTYAPDEYWDIDLVIERGIHIHWWKRYTIHEKAKIMAQHHLKSMIGVIDAHYREQDDIEEKSRKKNEARAKKKGKRGKLEDVDD